MANESSDALRLLCWIKEQNKKIIAISMGVLGQVSRITAPIFGSPFTYACLKAETTSQNQKSNLGQLSVQTLSKIYKVNSLHAKTALYGLIGDPVDLSLSDETHNHLMQVCGLDAVYVKMSVTVEELPRFLILSKKLSFQGLSVTMPLKEVVMPYVDHCDPQTSDIGAVNTLLFEQDKVHGFNTDGQGALRAIEKQGEVVVAGKKIVIIGAGGAARAIAYEACQRRGQVILVNRTLQKALKIAEPLKCTARGLEHMDLCFKEGYDILINCTPLAMPIDRKYICAHAVVMDIKTRSKESPFLMHASQKGGRIVYGYHMFIEQAVIQFDLWFKGRLNSQQNRNTLKQKIEENMLDSKR